MALRRFSNSFTADEILFMLGWLRKQALLDSELREHPCFRSVFDKFGKMSKRVLTTPPEAPHV